MGIIRRIRSFFMQRKISALEREKRKEYEPYEQAVPPAARRPRRKPPIRIDLKTEEPEPEITVDDLHASVRGRARILEMLGNKGEEIVQPETKISAIRSITSTELPPEHHANTIHYLSGIYSGESEPRVRKTIIRAVRTKFAGSPEAYVHLLKKALKDPEGDIREEAQDWFTSVKKGGK